MAVAMRYLQPIDATAYIEAGPVSDATSGITLGYRRYYDTDSGKMIAAFEWRLWLPPRHSRRDQAHRRSLMTLLIVG